jgi:hypothetical protein
MIYCTQIKQNNKARDDMRLPSATHAAHSGLGIEG